MPGRGPRPRDVTGSFNVNTDSREQTREFYNAIFPTSENVPINSTAVTASCVPGTNATAFQNATLRRINWFRAMAGIPAAITFDSGESALDQAGALIMSANNKLQHSGIQTLGAASPLAAPTRRPTRISLWGTMGRMPSRLTFQTPARTTLQSATAAGFCIRKPK